MGFVANLPSIITEITAGDIIHIDPDLTIVVASETRGLVVEPETRDLIIISETRQQYA